METHVQFIDQHIIHQWTIKYKQNYLDREIASVSTLDLDHNLYNFNPDIMLIAM